MRWKPDGETCIRKRRTLGAALAGSGRALVVTTGTLGLTPNRLATEEQVPDPGAAGGLRSVRSEEATLAMASSGVRASVVHLAPAVHDRVRQGLVAYMIALARKKGVSAFVGDGLNRWPAVHRLDAAHLFRLALETQALRLDRQPGVQQAHSGTAGMAADATRAHPRSRVGRATSKPEQSKSRRSRKAAQRIRQSGD
jgi:nucleoside-diphosphate-sugar epimerase